MNESTLHPASYIVIGFVEQIGQATSYDLKQWADGSIGYFWSFSRAQLYKEPPRLAELGYLSERQEEGGRRRRLYSATAKGRKALRSWLRTPTNEDTEIRDHALLKLYFAKSGTQSDLQNLIENQIQSHSKRLKAYQNIKTELNADPECRFYAASLHMGLRFEEVAIKFWRDLKKTPPKV